MAADRLLRRSARSYSQAGEDLIARFALRELGIMRPYYLDIGAHHPTWLSNTYFFYRRGSNGVCVEADPKLNRKIQRRRRRDLCLNVAIGTEDGTATLHVMRTSTLSTISAASMSEYTELGRRERREVQVPMLTPATLLREHCVRKPNLVSLDIEGIDLEVLDVVGLRRGPARAVHRRDADLHQAASAARKRQEIAALMADRGYFVYGDTRVNTVFVDERAWAAT